MAEGTDAVGGPSCIEASNETFSFAAERLRLSVRAAFRWEFNWQTLAL